MGSLIYVIISFILTTVMALLPMSPFTDLALPEGVDVAIGWLNWFVDVQGCCTMMAAWIACAVVVTVVQVIRDHLDFFIGLAAGD